MINFLEKLQGTYVKSTEKIELENLRKEMGRYLKLKMKHSLKEEDVLSEDEDDNVNNEEEQREFEEKMKKRMKSMMVQRPSVSAEAYGVYNKKEDFKVKIIKKSEEVREKISERLKKSFLFNNLEDKDMTTVIDAMGEKFVK
jgi:cAMP-dependent protein kinase regulator